MYIYIYIINRYIVYMVYIVISIILRVQHCHKPPIRLMVYTTHSNGDEGDGLFALPTLVVLWSIKSGGPNIEPFPVSQKLMTLHMHRKIMGWFETTPGHGGWTGWFMAVVFPYLMWISVFILVGKPLDGDCNIFRSEICSVYNTYIIHIYIYIHIFVWIYILYIYMYIHM